MAKQNPIVLVHGYSDEGESFANWAAALQKRGFDVSRIHTCSYRSLTNEVTIKDIAEGFDRALRIQAGLNADEEFDAIVHSTGMLVVRSWLTSYVKRRGRLKRLIGLAPATFGSPLAHKGRSWLGSIFKGNKEAGPDFMEAGDLVLDGLEMGSRFTWDLTHLDLLSKETYYGPDANTPYVFVFCGTKAYGGLRGMVNEPGTDGTVRFAATSLNTRKVNMDLTRDPAREGSRASVVAPKNLDSPVRLVKGVNHGTIMSAPPAQLIDLVAEALDVSDAAGLKAWTMKADALHARGAADVDEWQQFVVRLTDERGDPVTDYNLQLTTTKNRWVFGGTRAFESDVHVYSGDKSLRCFHVNLTKLKKEDLSTLRLHVMASSGSSLVGYHGLGSEKTTEDMSKYDKGGKWDAVINLSQTLKDPNFSFFYPFTTTLIELKVNREPMPLNVLEKNEVCWFI